MGLDNFKLAHPLAWLVRAVLRRVVPWLLIGTPVGAVVWTVTSLQRCDEEGSLVCGPRGFLAGAADVFGVPEFVAPVLLSVLVAGLAWWVAYRLVRALPSRPRPGPVIVEAIIEADGTDVRDRPDLVAVVRDRLAHAGIDPPSTVPALSSFIQPAQAPVTMADVHPVVAAVIALANWGKWRRGGYTLQATLTESSDGQSCELVFTLANQATGRYLLTGTLEAGAPDEAARLMAFRVAAFVGQLQALPSSARSPVWTPDHVSLRCYEDATRLTERYRYDEAVLSCEEGLNHDPVSLPLRYLLGTLHERLGHFLAAIDSYVDALNVLLYQGVGFGRDDKPAPDQAVLGALEPADRPIVSDEATQILWRYIVCLTFGDRWIKRWLDDIRRSDGDHPRAPLGYRRTTRELFAGSTNGKASYDRVEQHEIGYRTELARRFRGFVHVRYEALLTHAFPMLGLCFFGDDRYQPLGPAPVAPATAAGIEPPPIEATLRDTWDVQTLGTDPEVLVRGWILWLLKQASSAAVSGAAGDRPEHWYDRIDRWSHWPPGKIVAAYEPPTGTGTGTGTGGPGTTSLDRLVGALESGSDDGLEAIGFSRQRLAILTFHIANDLLATDLDEHHRARVAFVAAQLDLRLFFLMVSLDESDRLRHRGSRQVRTRPYLSGQLVKLHRLGMTYRRYERVQEIMRRSEGEPGSSALVAELLNEARTAAFSAPGRWGHLTERLRGWLLAEGDWNLWYYKACVLAMTLSPPPERERMATEAEWEAAAEESNRLQIAASAVDEWTRRNDAVAARAVAALNRAIVHRPRRGVTAIGAGAGDWILYLDPDLERLRSHRRFRRWAEALFEIDEPDQEDQEIDRRLWCLSHGRFERTQRLARLTSETFTAELLADPARDAAAHWFALKANPCEASVLWSTLQRDLHAWQELVGLPRFAFRSRLRVDAVRAISSISPGEGYQYPEYPTSTYSLRNGRLLDLDPVMELVCKSVELVSADLRTASELLEQPVDQERSEVVQELASHAGVRWWTLANLLTG